MNCKKFVTADILIIVKYIITFNKIKQNKNNTIILNHQTIKANTKKLNNEITNKLGSTRKYFPGFGS